MREAAFLPMNHCDDTKKRKNDMTTATKTFLAVSVTGFAVGGIVDFCLAKVDPMWTVALPVGAIFLGLFLISLVLEKEVALYDAEQAGKTRLARKSYDS
jgi:hypothetical protein